MDDFSDELVTGDAVVLEVRLARVPSRSIAEILDVGVQLFTMFVLLTILGATAGTVDDAALQGGALVVVVGVIVGYPVAFETLSRGRSLGKLALGLRVVRDDGGPERFRQALVRGVWGFVEIWLTFGVIAILASLASERGKRLGDVFGGTLVIRERMPASGGHAAWMRPELVPWAMNADLSRVPDPLALEARQLIARWADLHPGSRHEQAARLATEIARYVSPPSPPGTAPEAYLAAVLVERRRRAQLNIVATMPPPVATQPAPRIWGAPQTPLPVRNAEPPAPETGTGGFSVPG